MKRQRGALIAATCAAAITGAVQVCSAEGPDKATPLPPPKAEVRAEHTFKDPARREVVEAVARGIVAVYETMVAPAPVPGRMPFVVKPSRDGLPRANVGNDRYNVIVTCLDENNPTRLSYQLGHELGHYWIGPYSSSQFKESVCTALAFMAIDELAKQWRDCPPLPWFAGWAENMRDYHGRRTFQPQLDKLGLKDVDEAMGWASSKGPELLQAGNFFRDEEQVMAKVIERVLRRHPGQWGALQDLGKVTGKTDGAAFVKWHALVKPAQQPLVAELADAFGLPIGAAASQGGR